VFILGASNISACPANWVKPFGDENFTLKIHILGSVLSCLPNRYIILSSTLLSMFNTRALRLSLI
jgi:hypothetical protein